MADSQLQRRISQLVHKIATKFQRLYPCFQAYGGDLDLLGLFGLDFQWQSFLWFRKFVMSHYSAKALQTSNYSPQGLVLMFVSVTTPEVLGRTFLPQLPPYFGVGLLHVLCLVWNELQSLTHDQLLHADQPPWIGSVEKKMEFCNENATVELQAKSST